MRTIALAVLASIFVAHLSGCAASADAKPAEAPSGARSERIGASDATVRGTTASTRDREVDVAESAYAMKKTDEAPPSPPSPGSPPQTPKQQPAGQTTPSSIEGDKKKEPNQAGGAKDAPAAREFVIYTARFVMAVYQVEQGIAAVEKIARDHGGYLAIKKDREITVRVPRARFDQAIGSVDKIGDVLHRDVSAEDVTDEHVDLEIRIKNSRAMQHQLTALLVRANVKEALEIEKELHRVTEELERLEGRMKLLNDKVAFSTITVTFEPRGTTLTTQRPRLPFPWLSGLNLPTLLQLNEGK